MKKPRLPRKFVTIRLSEWELVALIGAARARRRDIGVVSPLEEAYAKLQEALGDLRRGEE